MDVGPTTTGRDTNAQIAIEEISLQFFSQKQIGHEETILKTKRFSSELPKLDKTGEFRMYRLSVEQAVLLQPRKIWVPTHNVHLVIQNNCDLFCEIS